LLKKPRRYNAPNVQYQRKLTAETIRRARRIDKRSRKPGTGTPWLFTGSILQKVQENLGFNLEKIIQRMKITGRTKPRVLDLGCLEGNAIAQIANSFSDVEAHGLGLSYDPFWKKQRNVSWHIGHAQKMPFENNYFDFVYSHFGITHAENLESALKELHRILRNGGEAIFNIEPAGFGEIKEINQIIAQTGFEVIKQETKFITGASNCVFYLRKK
jgi:ubiquinone/menaquinone biosynthesis C-methylase UbiE